MEKDQVLNYLYETKKRCRIFYGDVNTGRSWNEEYNVIGEIFKSTGVAPVYILLNNKRSRGGPALLDSCIIRITVDKVDIYRHPDFHIGKKKQSGTSVYIDGNLQATFKTPEQATRYIDFLEGRRNSK